MDLEQYPDQSSFMKAARAAGRTQTVEALKDCTALWITEALTRRIEDQIIAILKEQKAMPRNELYKKLRGDNHAVAFNEALRRLHRDTIIITYKDGSQEAMRKKGRRAEIIELLDAEPLPADVQKIVKDMKEVKAIGDPIVPTTPDIKKITTEYYANKTRDPDESRIEVPEAATGTSSPLPNLPVAQVIAGKPMISNLKSKSALISALGAGK